MASGSDADNPVVVSLSLSSLIQLIQLVLLCLCGYGLLRFIHLLQMTSRRNRRAKASLAKMMPSDQSKTTLEDSYLTSTETSQCYSYRRDKAAGRDKYHRFSPRKVKSKKFPTRSAQLHPVAERHDYVTEVPTNQSSFESDIVCNKEKEKIEISLQESSRDSVRNRRSFAYDNDFDLEDERPYRHPWGYAIVGERCGIPEDVHKCNDNPAQALRITYSKQSAAEQCHRQYLAGTQEEGAYNTFPSASDRLDCATQFVSRESCNVIDLSPSVSKKYMPADGGNLTPLEVSLVEPAPVVERTKKRNNVVKQDSSTTRSPNSRKNMETNEVRLSKPLRKPKGSLTLRQNKHPVKTQSQAKELQIKSHKARSKAKNRMANNSCTIYPDLNTNYAGVSLKECGKELHRLIQDTMREYGDWPTARSFKTNKHRDGTVIGRIGEINVPVKQQKFKCSPNDNGCDEEMVAAMYQFDGAPYNANGNKLLGRRDCFFYNCPREPVKKRLLNNYGEPLVLVSLLRELETLTKTISQNYENRVYRADSAKDAAIMHYASGVFRRPHYNNTRWCERRSHHLPFTNDCNAAICKDLALSKTHNEYDCGVYSPPKRFRSPNHIMPNIAEGTTSPIVKTRVSKRKKVLVETCPVPLDETELVCYMELVPKTNPIGGFQFSTVTTRPAAPVPKPFHSSANSSSDDTLECVPNKTYTAEDFRGKHFEHKPIVAFSKQPALVADLSQSHKENQESSNDVSDNNGDNIKETQSLSKESIVDAAKTRNVRPKFRNKRISVQKDMKPFNNRSTETAKLQDGCSLSRKRLTKKGSYVANFHRTARRMEDPAHSNVTRKNTSTNKRCSSPGKGSKQKKTLGRPSHITTPPGQTRYGIGHLKTKPMRRCKQKNILSPPNKTEPGQAKLFGVEGVQVIASSPRWPSTSGHRRTKKPLVKRANFKHRKVSNIDDDNSSLNAFELGDNADNEKIGSSVKSSEVYFDTLIHNSLPLGPTESVRYEMKSNLDFKLNDTQRRSKLKMDRKRHSIKHTKTSTRPMPEKETSRIHMLRSSGLNKNTASLIGYNVDCLDSDLRMEKTVMADNDDNVKTIPLKFYHDGKFYCIKEVPFSQMSPSERDKCQHEERKSQNNVAAHLNANPSGTSNGSVISGDLSSARRHSLQNHILLNFKAREMSLLQHKSKLMSERPQSKALSKQRYRHLKRAHKTDSDSDYLMTYRGALATVSKSTTSLELSKGVHGCRMGLFDKRKHRFVSRCSTPALPRRSRSSSDTSQSYLSNCPRCQKNIAMQMLHRKASLVCGTHQPLRHVNTPIANKTVAKRAVGPDDSDETKTEGKHKSKLESLRRNDRRLSPTCKEMSYEIAMNDKGLGVAKFIGYCLTSSTDEEEEESSLSTSFVLDTLDEISESLSDDNNLIDS